MSTTPQQNFNSDRMQSRTLTTLVNIAEQYEDKANDTATVAYDPTFWNDLQQTLQHYTKKRRKLAQAGSYTRLAVYLRALEQFGIPLAVGRARHRVENDDPLIIKTIDFWNDFYTDIKTFETNATTVTA